MTGTLLDRILGTGSLVVAIDGTPVELDQLGAVTIRHGRTKPDAQPEPSTASFTTKAELVPQVGQLVTVDLGPDARETYGLPRHDHANLDPDPRRAALSSWYAWTGGGGTTRAQLTGDSGWAHGITTAGRITFTAATPDDGGGGAAWGLTMTPGPFHARAQARSSRAQRLLLWVDFQDGQGNYYQPAAHVGVLAAPGQVVELELEGIAPAGYPVAEWYVFGNYPDSYGTGSVPWQVGDTLDHTGVLVTQDLPAGEPVPDFADAGYQAAQARRFHGRITDAKVTPPPGEGASWRHRVQLVATGELAKLGRQHIGDTPWPAELDGARAARILALATGVTVGPVDTGTVTIRPRDVDRQPVLQLLQQLAADADGVVLQRRDGSVVYHDADHRTAAATSLELTAAELLWPLRWSQDLAGMVNDLTVGYGTAEPQAEYRFTDHASIDALGETYAAKVATQLDQLADAERFAQLTVARRSRPWWDVDTMAVELLRTVAGGVHDQAAALLALELGDLLQVTGLPERGPLQLGRLWVEGWTETITPASWQLVLAVSPYGRSGPAARWADLDPATTWAELDPAMSWAGAAAWDPGTGPDGRWVGTPADLTWADLATTWASWPA